MAKRERKSVAEREPSTGLGKASTRPEPAPADDRPILIVTGSVGRGAPAPGGWGYVICYPSGQEVEGGGGEAETTLHRMALTAVIRGLERVGKTEAAPVRVVSSSQYTIDRACGKATRRADLDLWTRLDGLARGRRIAWEWEPDATMYFQDRAVELATLAMKRGARG
jgi:ribonuclease HI